jgi:gliding motility-associated-like protein
MGKTFVFILMIIFFACTFSKAQQNIFVGNEKEVFIGDGQTIGIYGSLFHNGIIKTKANARILFFGERWTNLPGSSLLDEKGNANSSHGAMIEFATTNLFNYSFRKQYINSYYSAAAMNGPSFAGLVINNPDGVYLESDINITQILSFQSGHLYLSGKTAVLGNDTGAAFIQGYHHKSFVVTGDMPGGSHLLLRNMKKEVEYVFPMGERDDQFYYHPVKMMAKNQTEDISASVFMGTYSSGNTGLAMRDSTVNTTWHFEKKRTTPNQFTISLQHNLPNEGQSFAAKKENAYVGMYHNGGWKAVPVSTPYSVPGNITTSSPIGHAVVNHASFEVNGTTEFYLSKFLGIAAGAAAGLLKPVNIFTPNGDGYNDYFDILNIDQFPDNEVVIYNRWGNEVFKTTKYSATNRFKGTGLPDGTYFYIIKINHSGAQSIAPEILKGFITILR